MGGQWHRTCGRIHILLWKGNGNHELGTGVFVHKRIISAVKRVEFVSDRMSYTTLSFYQPRIKSKRRITTYTSTVTTQN
jgi:hypothetical protein